MTTTGETHSTLITGIDLREYFRDSVTAALDHQQIDAAEDTVYYIVNLLAYFSEADKLFAATAEGIVLEPLAQIYADAVEAPRPEQQNQLLRRLGDVALLISGLFSASLNRKPVDIDYYIAMGGAAYGFLCDRHRGTIRGRALSAIFDELSKKFQAFVDVLAEVGERTLMNSSTDIMRLYEVWLRTGSPRSAARLRQIGIEPVPVGIPRHRH